MVSVKMVMTIIAIQVIIRVMIFTIFLHQCTLVSFLNHRVYYFLKTFGKNYLFAGAEVLVV